MYIRGLHKHRANSFVLMHTDYDNKRAKVMEKTCNYQLIVLCCLLLVSCSGSTTTTPVVYSGTIAHPDRPQSIVLIGDTQATGWVEFWRESNDDVRKAILDKVAEENPALILHVGDVVFYGSGSSHWEEFDNNAQEIRKRGIPIFPVLGNHEYFGNNATAQAYFFSRFPAADHQQWYSFRFDSLGFILLNSNFSELTDDEIHSQNAWYSRELAKLQADSSVSAIITACHHPPFTNSTVVDGDADVQSYFVSEFTDNRYTKTKLFVTGHCHSYEHFVHNGRHFLVTGGGGGPRQEVDTTQAHKYRDLYIGAPIRPLHFCTLTREGSELLIQMKCVDKGTGNWTVGDTFRIQ